MSDSDIISDILASIIAELIMVAVCMWIWNTYLSTSLGLPTVTYFQAMAIRFISSVYARKFLE